MPRLGVPAARSTVRLQALDRSSKVGQVFLSKYLSSYIILNSKRRVRDALNAGLRALPEFPAPL